MSGERIDLKVDGSVAVITLDDPGVLNALSTPMIQELKAALGEIEDPRRGVRCAVLTGAGRGFCAGANLTGSDPSEVMDEKGRLDPGRPLDAVYHPVLIRLAELRVPLVTAVNGVAAGAGMSLAMMGDLVVAARSARFVQAFRGIGLVPDCGSTFLLPRLVGWGRAMELSLLGEELSAERALEWGLVNRVYDDEQFRDRALDLAAELAAGPTVALGLIRAAYWQSVHNSYPDQLRLERELQRTAGQTQDFVEGVTAFQQKRAPRFTGA